MAKRIQLSFKKGEEDLYQYVMAHSNYSGHIKDCIRYFMEDNKKEGALPFEPRR